uniref:Uncharacterized protein n=1 Tax=Naja naja TaxID=35670 RepID=A0A8C6YET6_NAJNA
MKVPFRSKSQDMLLYGVIITHGASGEMIFPDFVSWANYVASNAQVSNLRCHIAVMRCIVTFSPFAELGWTWPRHSMCFHAAAIVTQQASQNNDGFILSLISLSYQPKLQTKLQSEDLLLINSLILFISGTADVMRVIRCIKEDKKPDFTSISEVNFSGFVAFSNVHHTYCFPLGKTSLKKKIA